MSPFERHALEALANTHCRHTLPPSAVGHMLWEKSDPETRKRNPSAQGLALLAGKFLRLLRQAGLAVQRDGWYITDAGRRQLEAENANP